MDRASCFLGGAAIGALTMYYFDPDRGRVRRSVCEDQWMARGRRAARYLDKAGRDLANRTRGLAHEARHVLRGETPPEDGHRVTFDIMHDNLAPGTRLVLGSLGCGLFAWGLAEEAPEACVLGTIGAALLVPAVTGHGVASVFGGGEAGSPTRQQGQARQQAQGRQQGESRETARASQDRHGQPVPVM